MNSNDFHFAHTHCIFRRGSGWFALPAVSVREVILRPPVVIVPHSDPILAGLCHVRGEFLPALRLDSLLVENADCLPSEEQMIVVNGPEGSWGLLTDEVEALATLETSTTPETGFEDLWSEAVAGWSAYESQVVRVLDPNRFYRATQRALEQWWEGGLAAPDAHCEPADEPATRTSGGGSAPADSEQPSTLDSVCVNPQPVSG
jgi:chemotaxis signal transduction protein